MYFDYPRSYESAGTLDTIKLEIEPMAAWSADSHIFDANCCLFI